MRRARCRIGLRRRKSRAERAIHRGASIGWGRFLAFARMMLAKGRVGRRTLISERTIEMMARDHLTVDQKAGAGLYTRFFRLYGWGFGVSVVTAPGDPRGPSGTYGWDGGLGTSWYTRPRDNVIAILLTQRAWESFTPPFSWSISGKR